MPLTPNGKVDRKALLPPNLADLPTHEYVAPETETERKLVEIWSEVLSIPAEMIGIHANFFSLGGHSLLLTQMRIRCLSEFDTHISLRLFFQKTTVLSLGRALERIINLKLIDIDALSDNEANDLLSELEALSI